MHAYHLDCGPVLPALLCRLARGQGELTLIDTTLGAVDLAAPSTRVRTFAKLVCFKRAVMQTVAHRESSLGYDRAEAKNVLITHIHLHHSGGLPGSVDGSVRVMRSQYEAAIVP